MEVQTPDQTFKGVEHLGEGLYKAEFQVYEIKVSSDEIFGSHKKNPPATEEYRTNAIDFAKSLPTFTESTCVRSSDGVPIVYFIKKGMLSPWGKILGQIMSFLSLAAIRALLAVYPPPQRLRKNARHKSNLQEEVEKSKSLGRKFGVFHWCYWILQGQRVPQVSKETTPEDPVQLEALKRFFSATRFEHHILSMWLKALDPEGWKRYNDLYQRARSNGKLGILDDGDMGIETGHTFLVNAIANPHRDPGDVKRGWTMTYPWGNFTGGEVVFLELGLRFGQEAGDILMAPAAVLLHMVLPTTSGDRYSHVWFTKQNVLEPPQHKYFCNIKGCADGFSQKTGLTKHWEEKSEPYHEAARQRKAAGKAIPSDTKMTPRDDDTSNTDLNDANADASEGEDYAFGTEEAGTEPTTSSSRPAKRRKVAEDLHALPAGAPTDTRKRYHCVVAGCKMSREGGWRGYTHASSLNLHKKGKHAA